MKSMLDPTYPIEIFSPEELHREAQIESHLPNIKKQISSQELHGEAQVGANYPIYKNKYYQKSYIVIFYNLKKFTRGTAIITIRHHDNKKPDCNKKTNHYNQWQYIAEYCITIFHLTPM